MLPDTQCAANAHALIIYIVYSVKYLDKNPLINSVLGLIYKALDDDPSDPVW